MTTTYPEAVLDPEATLYSREQLTQIHKLHKALTEIYIIAQIAMEGEPPLRPFEDDLRAIFIIAQDVFFPRKNSARTDQDKDRLIVNLHAELMEVKAELAMVKSRLRYSLEPVGWGRQFDAKNDDGE